MSRKVRIGTRESALALWQANYIKNELGVRGADCELITIKSDGEIDLVTPLYEMGVQGIFTKTLDVALLQDRIDIAVHSLKDVPTQTPKGITLAAVPKRGNHQDVLVYKDKLPDIDSGYMVATSSLRRSAQWKHRYPQHSTDVLRGNINTRLQKLLDNDHWDGALFAGAGIDRINLAVPNMQPLDWMIPAPAQGALGVMARDSDDEILELCKALNDSATAMATGIERGFLRGLMGGCSMPIGGIAEVDDARILFRGCVLTTDGRQMAGIELESPLHESGLMAEKAAQKIFENGGRQIIQTFGR